MRNQLQYQHWVLSQWRVANYLKVVYHQDCWPLPKHLKRLRKSRLNVSWFFSLIRTVFYQSRSHVGTCFCQSPRTSNFTLSEALLRVIFLIYNFWFTVFRYPTMVEAFATTYWILVIPDRVKKYFHSIINFTWKINLMVLSSSDKRIFELWLAILLIIILAFTTNFISVESFLQNLFNTWFCIYYSPSHSLVLQG